MSSKVQAPPKRKYILKDQSAADTILPCTNALSTDAVSVGLKIQVLNASYIIHPSNHRLFPNLQGIWRSFEQYKLGATIVQCQPLSSTLNSGAYLCALAPSVDQQNISPIFSELINYATSQVSTIFKPMLYKFAGNILHRLGSYLMDNQVQSTSSPGTLIIASTTSSNTANGDVPLPIMTLKSQVHLKDFVPAPPEPTPSQAGLSSVYFQTQWTNPVMFFQNNFTNVRPGYGCTVNVTADNSNWFKFAASGNYSMVITVAFNNKSSTWRPKQIEIDGAIIKPSQSIIGLDVEQYVYRFAAQAGSQLSSATAPGYSSQWNTVNNLTLSIYQQGSQPSLAKILTQVRHHALGQTVKYRNKSQACFSVQQKLQNVKQHKIQNHLDRQTVSFECIPEQGYCWLRFFNDFKALKCTSSTQTIEIRNLVTNATVTLPFTPFITTTLFKEAVATLSLQEQLINHYRIVFSSANICHIRKLNHDEQADLKSLRILQLYDLIGWTPHDIPLTWTRIFREKGITVLITKNPFSRGPKHKILVGGCVQLDFNPTYTQLNRAVKMFIKNPDFRQIYFPDTQMIYIADQGLHFDEILPNLRYA